MSPDAGLLSINSPITQDSYSSDEVVNITVKNYGINELTDVKVNYMNLHLM